MSQMSEAREEGSARVDIPPPPQRSQEIPQRACCAEKNGREKKRARADEPRGSEGRALIEVEKESEKEGCAEGERGGRGGEKFDERRRRQIEESCRGTSGKGRGEQTRRKRCAEEKRRGEKTEQKERVKRERGESGKREGEAEKVGKKLGGKEAETVAVLLRRRRKVHARQARESPGGAVPLQRCPEKSLLHSSSVVSEAFARVEATL
eukprot:2228159-Rhodomonas_salina.1